MKRAKQATLLAGLWLAAVPATGFGQGRGVDVWGAEVLPPSRRDDGGVVSGGRGRGCLAALGLPDGAVGAFGAGEPRAHVQFLLVVARERQDVEVDRVTAHVAANDIPVDLVGRSGEG